MKMFNWLLILITGFCVLISCTKSEDFEYYNNEADPSLKDAEAKPNCRRELNVPFKAVFRVNLESGLASARCESYGYSIELTMVGEGQATHLGRIRTRMAFCSEGNPVGSYGNGTGLFVAANGDELYFDLPYGVILWNEGDNADYYPTRFNDEFYFSGGTGRFEGASGMFMTNAYVHFPVDENDIFHTDFFSKGTLTLTKGLEHNREKVTKLR